VKKVKKMIEQSMVERIKKSVDELNTMCAFYVETKQEYAALNDKRKVLETEKREAEERQKKQDKFLEVVLLAEHKTTEVDEVSKKLELVINHLESLSDELNNARTDILKKFKELPFPIDPHNSSVNGSVTKFKMIEGIAFTKETLQTLCELLELPYPLNFEGITYYPDEIVVNVASVDEAMNQVVQSVHTLRFKISDLLNAYSNIDQLCARVRSSNRYAPILEALFINNQPLSVTEIAQQTGLNENITYQACYNMLRDRWSPNPIKRTPDGKFFLTITGEITMKRYSEKYGFSLPRAQVEPRKDLEEYMPQTKESQPKE
jgi:hypothetical protein